MTRMYAWNGVYLQQHYMAASMSRLCGCVPESGVLLVCCARTGRMSCAQAVQMAKKRGQEHSIG